MIRTLFSYIDDITGTTKIALFAFANAALKARAVPGAIATSQTNNLVTNNAREARVAHAAPGSCTGAMSRAPARAGGLCARGALPSRVADTVAPALAYPVPVAVIKLLARNDLIAVQARETKATVRREVGSPHLFHCVGIGVPDPVHGPDDQGQHEHRGGVPKRSTIPESMPHTRGRGIQRWRLGRFPGLPYAHSSAVPATAVGRGRPCVELLERWQDCPVKTDGDSRCGKTLRRTFPSGGTGARSQMKPEDKLTKLRNIAMTFGETLEHCSSLSEVGIAEYETILRAAGEEPGKHRKTSDDDSRLVHLRRRVLTLGTESDSMLLEDAKTVLAAIWQAAAHGPKPPLGFSRIITDGGRFSVVLRSTAPSVDQIRSLANDAEQVRAQHKGADALNQRLILSFVFGQLVALRDVCRYGLAQVTGSKG